MSKLIPPDDRIESLIEPWDGQLELAPKIFSWTDVHYVRTSIKETVIDSNAFQIPETFAYPLEHDRYLIYSPLAGELGIVNKDALRIIRQLKEIYPNPFLATLSPVAYRYVVDFLRQHTQLLRPKSVFTHQPRIYRERLDLCLTSACNLRCVYCFAGGGERPRHLSWDIARTAIDLTVQNALRKGTKEIEVAFQGDGEAFVAWPMMVKCTNYIRNLTKQNNLRSRIWAITNGYLSSKMVEWAVHNLDSLSISLDGPPDIQDIQRPTLGGQGSSSQVIKTIQLIDALNGNYSLRATITRSSVNRMGEITSYILGKFPRVKSLVLDPLFPSYISSRNGWEPPTASDFVRGYLEAQEIADKGYLHLGYTGYFDMCELTGYHCDAWGVHLAITPDGCVTSCPIVTSAEDPRSGFCIYGKYYKGRFEYDWGKLKRILARNLTKLSDCNNCFARWHCAGECYSRLMMISDQDEPLRSFRCEINRQLMLNQLKRILTRAD